ncbi:MAG: TRIC cation channel family protein, partial [Exiguobacterium sp.]|nr:TRIC cation channel family protein [Exiguobacterium sp.]
DAIGLVAFAFQGAQVAIKLDLPLSAAIAAAVLTGVGGGVVRDLLAGRKPLVLQSEVYAIWAILIAVITYYFKLEGGLAVYALLIVVATLRVISYYRKWNLPARKVR